MTPYSPGREDEKDGTANDNEQIYNRAGRNR